MRNPIVSQSGHIDQDKYNCPTLFPEEVAYYLGKRCIITNFGRLLYDTAHVGKYVPISLSYSSNGRVTVNSINAKLQEARELHGIIIDDLIAESKDIASYTNVVYTNGLYDRSEYTVQFVNATKDFKITIMNKIQCYINTVPLCIARGEHIGLEEMADKLFEIVMHYARINNVLSSFKDICKQCLTDLGIFTPSLYRTICSLYTGAMTPVLCMHEDVSYSLQNIPDAFKLTSEIENLL